MVDRSGTIQPGAGHVDPEVGDAHIDGTVFYAAQCRGF